MLLFISALIEGDAQKIRFQYISCYCLSSLLIVLISLTMISIHLMLLFIFIYCIPCTIIQYISIHLMLLFIILTVPVLPAMDCISIHLMLLFINVFILCYSGFCKFQYISCYCLSQFQYHQVSIVLAFQYISCYCLSSPLASIAVCKFISIHLMLLFIQVVGVM